MPIWTATPEFNRIVEILKEYWLSDPKEFRVRITMDFINIYGETQSKRIVWQNPNFECDPPFNPYVLNRLSDFNSQDVVLNEDSKFWNVQNIRRI